MQSTQGTPRLPGSDNQRGLCSWAQDCNNQKASSGQDITPRTLRSRLNHIPSPQVKKGHLIVLELQPEDRLQVCHTPKGYRGALREAGRQAPFSHPPLASPLLTGTSQQGAYTLVWSPDACNCCPGDTSRSPSLEVSRVYDCSPIGLYTSAYLKSCCLSIWLPISLNLGAEWDHSLWNTDRSWCILNNWSLSRISQAT